MEVKTGGEPRSGRDASAMSCYGGFSDKVQKEKERKKRSFAQRVSRQAGAGRGTAQNAPAQLAHSLGKSAFERSYKNYDVS